ncbi:autotransporter outer membrane beta-barrel domain-containing protein [Limnobaculum xujianqingii]|nr:autotransporter outer membrane beta-barrel domain-containing protein [Limnobaculum xujianqingii]
MRKQWKKVMPVVLSGSFLYSPMTQAAELTDQFYTSSISSITSGNHTVNNGDVTLDASGYTGAFAYQRAIINTMNGAVNIGIGQSNTLTIKGFNNNSSQQNSTLYAYKRAPTLSGTMTFTGGNIVVSNEVTNSYANIYGLFADNEGQFSFKSDGDNKVNLTVLMPQAGLVDTHRHGIALYNSGLDFDGGNFIVKVDGDPGANSIDRRIGIAVSAGSNVDVKADNVLIEANEVALFFPATIGDYPNHPTAYDVVNTAKFDAETIIFRGSQGIMAGLSSNTFRTRNVVEFTGNTLIEAIVRGDENNIFGEIGGGRAIDVMATDITFNSNDTVRIIGENLTPLGIRPGYEHDYLGWIDGYWLRTVSLTDGSTLTSNADLSLSSNGGYYNTGLYVWKSQAQFNGKTDITLKNGVDTARAVYVYDGGTGTSKAEFNDDLSISLVDTEASYIAGIEVAAGGKVDVKKGLLLNDNSDIYWSLYSRGADSQIGVNTTATGTVQVKGDIGAINDGAIDMTLNNQNSYLTAASYTSTSGSTSRGIVNLDISNQAVWNMTDNSSVTSLSLTSQGRVNILSPDNNGSFKTLMVHGDYTGGGSLTINTALGGDDSETDKMMVEGNTSGITDLYVNNYNGIGGQTTNGIEVINVAGESDGIFQLASGHRVVAGAYEYNVTKSGNNWYLVNTIPPVVIPPEPEPEPGPTPEPTPEPEPEDNGGGIKVIRPEAGAYIANLAAANSMFTTRLHDRLGETQYTDFLTGESKVTSLWLRQEGGHNRSKTQSSQSKTQTNRYVVQMGGDIAQWSSDGLDRLHMGLMAGYGYASGNTDAKYTAYRAKSRVDGYALGLYGTWYANQVDKSGLYVDSWVQYAWFDNSVKGDGLAEEKYDSKGWLASVETGYSFKLGENERTSYWLQPKAQLTWMGVHADKHYETNGTKVTGNGDNLSTRLGLRAYAQGHNAVDDNTGRVFQPFVEANWLYNSKNFGVTMNETSDYQAGTRNIGELKVGVEGHLNKNLNLWGNVAQQIGDKGYSDTQAMIGVKYSF